MRSETWWEIPFRALIPSFKILTLVKYLFNNYDFFFLFFNVIYHHLNCLPDYKFICHLIAVLTIWWCPCVESSLVLFCWKRMFAMTPRSILLTKLWKPQPCFISYSKAKFAGYSRYLLTSYFFIPVPYDKKDIFFWC